MDKGFNLEEAENFIDNIYQHKFDSMEETLEDGTQVVHLGSLDNIKWTDFECASFTLLRGEQRLKNQVKKQKEIIDKAIDFIKNGDLLYLANKNSVVYRDNIEVRAVADRLNDLLKILEDKEVL